MVSRRGTALQDAYRRLPEGLRAAIPLDLRLWLRDHVSPIVFGTAPPRIRALEGRLWGGFSGAALAEIAAMLEATPSRASPRARLTAEAARVRARWWAARGEAAAALADLRRAAALWPSFGRDPGQVVLEAGLLARQGAGAAARARLATARDLRPFEVAALLVQADSWNPALAGAAGSAAETLAALNAVFARFGLAGIALRDPALPPGLDNLVPAGPVRTAQCDARVSVIVPMHNAGPVLATALDGLAAQSWHDLEVIVVDDASTDDSAAIAAGLCDRDPRFRLIRAPENRGSYVARNIGLAAATGAFVTTHDADDWSHPDKIRLQMAALRAGRLPFSLSGVLRTGAALDLRGPLRPTPRPVTRNFSSLLAPRALLERMGGWDRVRIGADSEMIHRLEWLHGTGPVAPVLPDCPLSFARVGAGSLTGSGTTGLASFYHGIRREYHEARRSWHTGLDRDRVLAAGLAEPPPEAEVPPMIRAIRGTRAPVALLVVADFNRAGQEARHRALLAAVRARGVQAAILHHPDARDDVTRPLDPVLRRAAAAAGIVVIAPGERLAAEVVLVCDPAALATAMDDPPAVTHRHLVVAPDGSQPDRAPDPAALRAGVAALFGGPGRWLEPPLPADAAALLDRVAATTGAALGTAET